MTAIDKANAVVDGLADETVLIGRRWYWFWPVTVTLTAELRKAIFDAVEHYAGQNPKLMGLSERYCCERPRVVVWTFHPPRAAVFTPKVRSIIEVCSVCGDVHCRQ